MRRVWDPVNLMVVRQGKGHESLPRFGPPEGKDLRPACLYLY
jgi:hypothetical protein